MEITSAFPDSLNGTWQPPSIPDAVGFPVAGFVFVALLYLLILACSCVTCAPRLEYKCIRGMAIRKNHTLLCLLWFSLFFSGGIYVIAYSMPLLEYQAQVCTVLDKGQGTYYNGATGTLRRGELQVTFNDSNGIVDTFAYDAPNAAYSYGIKIESFLDYYTIGQQYECWVSSDNTFAIVSKNPSATFIVVTIIGVVIPFLLMFVTCGLCCRDCDRNDIIHTIQQRENEEELKDTNTFNDRTAERTAGNTKSNEFVSAGGAFQTVSPNQGGGGFVSVSGGFNSQAGPPPSMGGPMPRGPPGPMYSTPIAGMGSSGHDFNNNSDRNKPTYNPAHSSYVQEQQESEHFAAEGYVPLPSNKPSGTTSQKFNSTPKLTTAPQFSSTNSESQFGFVPPPAAAQYSGGFAPPNYNSGNLPQFTTASNFSTPTQPLQQPLQQPVSQKPAASQRQVQLAADKEVESIMKELAL